MQENSIFENKQGLLADSAQGAVMIKENRKPAFLREKTFPSREQYSHLLRPDAGSNIK